MRHRLVVLHGWGANADDLRPLGESLSKLHSTTLDVIALDAPHPHPDTRGRQWYGLFPARWEDVPKAVSDLKNRLLGLNGGEEALQSTVLFGFSQGGAMALHCGCELPLAGVISCSGYPHPAWQPNQDHPDVLVLHGKHDEIVPIEAIDAIWNQLNKDRRERMVFDDGHTIPQSAIPVISKALDRMLNNSRSRQV